MLSRRIMCTRALEKKRFGRSYAIVCTCERVFRTRFDRFFCMQGARSRRHPLASIDIKTYPQHCVTQ
jgi:hypothetical protein